MYFFSAPTKGEKGGDEEEYVILNAKKGKENYKNEDMGGMRQIIDKNNKRSVDDIYLSG
jgi:hypothetical protein